VVPLSVVARLEEVDATSIEVVDGRQVLQYRGKLMPLIGVHGAEGAKKTEHQSIIVFADGDNRMGLLVDEIVDIVEDRLSIEMGANQPGIVGSAIVSGTAMDVLDTSYYLTRAVPNWFERVAPGATESGPIQHKLLVVDDNKFFVRVLSPFLQSQGYRVTSVHSAQRALALLESGREFDAIISDIEMPEMSGLEFAEKVRANDRWNSIPMIALSSYYGAEQIERGKEAGFASYIKKLDSKALLAALDSALSVERKAA
jgi:two-component system chemotaxis sensor kinase CheA